jgi:hypothetical protein
MLHLAELIAAFAAVIAILMGLAQSSMPPANDWPARALRSSRIVSRPGAILRESYDTPLLLLATTIADRSRLCHRIWRPSATAR